MGKKMPESLTFTMKWECLDEGSPEERATFGAIGLRAGNVWLSAGKNKLSGSFRNAPLVPSCRLAEWIAWNWWRLRWEPKRSSLSESNEWLMAHRFTAVGGGYAWPNATIWSEGERIRLAVWPTHDSPSVTFQYVANSDITVSSQEFEQATDKFMNSVCERMNRKGIRESNLHDLWRQLNLDRRDSEICRRRKLEALLGLDPREAEPKILDNLIHEAALLGESAVDELAVAGIAETRPGISRKLKILARDHGFEIAAHNSFRFHRQVNSIVSIQGEPAWVAGSETARAARREASLGDRPVSNRRLCELAAVSDAILRRPYPHLRRAYQEMAFVLGEDQTRRMVLRSKWEAGRRFELARLVGDQLIGQCKDRLLPATRTYTYRQQLQRAFAAEFLSPFEAVEAALDGDHSDEKQQQVAEHFKVAPMTIRTQLVNHGMDDREALEADRHLR